MIPWNASRNATLKMPADGEPLNAELCAVHVSPPSCVARTLDADAPPVTIHALSLPCTATQVPLEGNESSPAKAGGRRSAIFCQVVPSMVRITGKRPFTE